MKKNDLRTSRRRLWRRKIYAGRLERKHGDDRRSGITTSIAAAGQAHVADHAISVRVVKVALDAARLFVAATGDQGPFRMIGTAAATSVLADEYHKTVVKDGFHSRCPLRGASQKRTGEDEFHHNGICRRTLQR